MPEPGLDQLMWLVGNWHSHALDGIAEEHWQAPSGGSMLGSFKLIVDGRVKFYELMTISEEGDTLILRIKHLNPDFSTWEAKEDCVSSILKQLDPGSIRFEHFQYTKIEEDKIVARVDTSSGDQLTFDYRRF
jgi:hypothetical protein